MPRPTDSFGRPRRRSRRARRRRRVAVLLLGPVLAAATVFAVWSITTSGRATAPSRHPASNNAGHAKRRVAPRRTQPPGPLRLQSHPAGRLPYPIQDAAAVPLRGGGLALLGGLSASDQSMNEAIVARRGASRDLGQLPQSLHDAPGVRLGSRLFVFGGGTGVRQLADITEVDLASGRTQPAGSLPAASSDSAATSLGGTAYIVGGFTGTAWLDTVVAWRPGSRARVVAHLPTPIRYAAVAASEGAIVIAGGSLPDGSASRAILTFDPRSGLVRTIGRLPTPTTHAAAAAIGGTVYLVGGRGPVVNTPTARILAIDPASGHVRAAGRLDLPLSDLAAVGDGKAILVAGGHAVAGTVSTVSLLKPITRAPSASVQVRRSSAGVYARDEAGMLTGPARHARPLVYVPNSQSNTVDVIDPTTFRVIDHFAVGQLPQHVTPSWDLSTLYVDNDRGNSLTPIDPTTGKPRGRPIPVTDPYNLYFTPDGRSAIVVAERLARLDFRNPHTFKLQASLHVPCRGVDHMDFTADGRQALASCEFSGELIRIDLRRRRVVATLRLRPGAMPQDVKLSPDGRIFYVADMMASGLWEISARRTAVVGFVKTGAGAHGLYPSRDGRLLYASNRSAGTVSVISFRTHRVIHTWRIPHGTPDMGGVSADGRVLWLSGRYSREVYAIDTTSGRLLARIPVGAGPHGLCVWPQPGRYSLGHTGILR